MQCEACPNRFDHPQATMPAGLASKGAPKCPTSTRQVLDALGPCDRVIAVSRIGHRKILLPSQLQAGY